MEISKERIENAAKALQDFYGLYRGINAEAWKCIMGEDNFLGVAERILTADAAYQSDIVDKLADALEKIRDSKHTALGQSWVYINPICDEALKLVGRS